MLFLRMLNRSFPPESHMHIRKQTINFTGRGKQSRSKTNTNNIFNSLSFTASTAVYMAHIFIFLNTDADTLTQWLF